MKEIFKSKIFWLVAVVFAGIFFAATLGLNKTNQSEVDVLLLPKNDATARNIEQVVGNAKQIPHNLSFYNKILELNPDITDTLNNLADDKRKQAWNAEFQIEQIRKSGMLRIKNFNADQWQAELLSRQIASSLVVVMNKYYDPKTELEVRIVDGPIASQITKNNVGLNLLVSLILGLIFGSVASILVKLVSKKNDEDLSGEESAPEQGSFAFPKISFPEIKINKPEVAPDQKKPFDFKIEEEAALVQPKKESLFSFGSKKAAAPENLPVADEAILDMLPKEEPTEAPVEEIKTAPIDTTREATPEEVRERLNKLLGGGIPKQN